MTGVSGRNYAVLILLVYASYGFCLNPEAAVSQYQHNGWDMHFGLPVESVRCIIQSKSGYLWLGTPAGLARFDGLRFRLFHKGNTKEMLANQITSLLEDRNGTLWIGTDGGGLLSYQQKKFVNYSTASGLSDNVITALAQDSHGTLWIATPGEINVFKNGEFISYPVPHTLALFADNRSLLIGTEEGITIDKGGDFEEHPGNAVTAIYRSPGGNLWLGVRNRGLCKMEGSKISVVFQTSQVINSILEDRDHQLWVGTDSGLHRFQNSSWQLHPEITARVTSLMEDREGSVWVTTMEEGLHQLAPSPFISVSKDEGMRNDRTWCVIEDHTGAIWIGTNQGVSRWKDHEITNYEMDGPVKTMSAGKNSDVWAIANNGLMRWDGKQWTLQVPQITASVVLVDSQGQVWIGGKEGLRKYASGKLELYESAEVTALYQDKRNTLWAGTVTGLKRLNAGILESAHVNDFVYCIYETRDGTLWVGSDQGVHAIKDGRVTTYTRANGLFNEVVFSIIEDSNGTLWMSSRTGVFRAVATNGTFHCTPYGPTHGLKTGEASDGNPAAWKSQDGKLWFAMIRGAGVIDPVHFFVNQLAPPVVISSMTADRIPVDLSSSEIRLPADISRLEFQFAGLSFLGSVHCRYVLQGFDQFWTNAQEKIAVYRKLPPGKYRFKALACNKDGIWNTEGATVSFEVKSSDQFGFDWTSLLVPVIAALAGFFAGWFLRNRRSNPKITPR